jgi:shikimate kinase
MPGSGKSTIGAMLAKILSYDFIDTDLLIEKAHKRSLQHIVDQAGYLALRKMEAETLLKLHTENHVIATGGSAIYSDQAISHLSNNGIIVFLDIALESLEKRVNSLETRGLARQPGQTLKELYIERQPLYKKAANIIINCSGLSKDEICAAIVSRLC